jgi:hypothetical protein
MYTFPKEKSHPFIKLSTALGGKEKVKNHCCHERTRFQQALGLLNSCPTDFQTQQEYEKFPSLNYPNTQK